MLVSFESEETGPRIDEEVFVLQRGSVNKKTGELKGSGFRGVVEKIYGRKFRIRRKVPREHRKHFCQDTTSEIHPLHKLYRIYEIKHEQ